MNDQEWSIIDMLASGVITLNQAERLMVNGWGVGPDPLGILHEPKAPLTAAQRRKLVRR